MKRALVVFILCLILVVGCVTAAALPLHASREQVAVTAETLCGDPAAAQGFTAHQSAQYKNHLIWDLTIPLAQPEDSAAAVSYALTGISEESTFSGKDVLYFNLPNSTGFGVSGQENFEHVFTINPDMAFLQPIVQGVLDRTGPGESRTETFTLSDYCDDYPMSAHIWPGESWDFRGPDYDEVALSQAVDDFFRLPVDPAEQWDISVVKDAGGNPSEFAVIGREPVFDPYLLSVYSREDLFFAFAYDTAAEVSFEQVPGGMGLYHMALTQREEKLVMELDTLANVCSLPQGAAVLDLAFSPDGRSLALTYCLGEDYTCLVLDPKTMMVKQMLSVPAESPVEGIAYTRDETGAESSYPVMTWGLSGSFFGENFMVLYGDETFHLYSLEPQGYRYQFTGPTQEHMILGEYTCLQGAWSGDRLAVGTVTAKYQGWERATGLTLSVFEKGELVYQGTYETSLDQISTTEARIRDLESDALDWYDTIRLWEGHELALAWTE